MKTVKAVDYPSYHSDSIYHFISLPATALLAL